MALVAVEDLSVGFGTGDGARTAVDRVSFEIEAGETLALVGESGSGKSLTALALMRLLPDAARITGGRISLDGQSLDGLSERQMTRLRGRDIAMVFQEPMTSLNPLMTAGAHIAEPLRLHQGLSRKQARSEAIALLSRVGIPAPAERHDEYPHRMSGGMRQRVMIATALACNPRLLVADEPTTALDVTIQAQILDLIASLRDELGMAVLLITHDLAVVEDRADRVAVMYAGRLVERLPARDLETARHPYSTALLRCTPGETALDRLETIPGSVPPLDQMPAGCRFAPRCPLAVEACTTGVPPMRPAGPSHSVACIRSDA